MNTRLPETDWNQLRAAYTAGAGLRPLARTAGIPAGTVLARAHREGWSQLKKEALSMVNGQQMHTADDVVQSIAIESAERGKRHVERMQNLCDGLGHHAASLTPATLFDQISKLNSFDLVARRSFGLDSGTGGTTLNVLIGDGGPAFAGDWED